MGIIRIIKNSTYIYSTDNIVPIVVEYSYFFGKKIGHMQFVTFCFNI